MKIVFLILAVLVTIMFGLRSMAFRNVSWVKEHSSIGAEQIGYEIVGYEGYQSDIIHGGLVWYTLRHKIDNGIMYHAGFARWDDEVHVYSLKAIDAIRPNNN